MFFGTYTSLDISGITKTVIPEIDQLAESRLKVEILSGCDVTTFDICGTTYSSITLNFINITEDDIIAIIPCPCPE